MNDVDCCNFTFKIAIVGDSGVGKSALALRLVRKRFPSEHDATIGVEFQVHTLYIRENDDDLQPTKIKLQIWDTAGQEQFMALTQNYFRNIAGAVVVFSADDPSPHIAIKKWIERVQMHNNLPVPILICGNKMDLLASDAPRITTEFTTVFTSAFTGQGVELAFRSMAELILKGIRQGEADLSTVAIRVHAPTVAYHDETSSLLGSAQPPHPAIGCCRV